MIIQGNNDPIVLSGVPDAVVNSKHLYVAVCDTTGVLHHWTEQDILIDKKAKALVCDWKRLDTINLPAGPVYIECYAVDENGNTIWSREIPEFIDNRHANRGIGIKISDQTAHGDIVSFDEIYDSKTDTLIIGDADTEEREIKYTDQIFI